MIDLKPFCGKNDIREQLNAPMSDAEHTYATNGHIIIRVPRREDVPEGEFAKKCADLIAKHPVEGVPREWVPIPELPPAEMVACWYCEGGTLEMAGPCEECDGAGKIERLLRVDIGGVDFARKYLALLKELPNCTIAPNGAEPAWFKCNGGIGLLMPVRKD